MSEPRFGAALTLQQYEAILDSVADAVFTINRDYVITSFNRAAEQATGFDRVEAVGRFCYDVLRSSVCRPVGDCPMTQLLATGSASLTRQYSVLTRHDKEMPFSVSVYPLHDGAGGIVGGIETFRALPPVDAVGTPASGPSKAAASGLSLRMPLGMRVLEASQRRVIEEVLRRHHWNRSAACEELGLSRTTLWRKMRKLGINPQPPESA